VNYRCGSLSGNQLNIYGVFVELSSFNIGKRKKYWHIESTAKEYRKKNSWILL